MHKVKIDAASLPTVKVAESPLLIRSRLTTEVKENFHPSQAFSKDSKSTTAMSLINKTNPVNEAFSFRSGDNADALFNMRNLDSALDGSQPFNS